MNDRAERGLMDIDDLTEAESARLFIAVFYSSRCDRLNTRMQRFWWPEHLQHRDDDRPTFRPGWRLVRWPVETVMTWLFESGRRKSARWADRWLSTGVLPSARWKGRA